MLNNFLLQLEHVRTNITEYAEKLEDNLDSLSQYSFIQEIYTETQDVTSTVLHTKGQHPDENSEMSFSIPGSWEVK